MVCGVNFSFKNIYLYLERKSKQAQFCKTLLLCHLPKMFQFVWLAEVPLARSYLSYLRTSKLSLVYCFLICYIYSEQTLPTFNTNSHKLLVKNVKKTKHLSHYTYKGTFYIDTFYGKNLWQQSTLQASHHRSNNISLSTIDLPAVHSIYIVVMFKYSIKNDTEINKYMYMFLLPKIFNSWNDRRSLD